MVEISDRSVYRYILEARPIKVVGKQYFHVQIARGMEMPAASMLVKQVLDRLVGKGYVQVFKKVLTITLPIDPEALSDDPVTNRPPPDVLPDLAGKIVRVKGLGAPLAAAADETRDQAGESDIAAAAAGTPEPIADPPALEEAAAALAAPSPPAQRITAPVQLGVGRQARRRRPDPPSPSAKMRDENRRLVADNERLKRELATATRRAGEAEAQLRANRVPTANWLISYLAQAIVAMSYQFAGARAQLQAELAEARRDLRDAEGTIRTLERRPATDQSDQVTRLEKRIRDLDNQVTRLKAEKARLNEVAAGLRRQVAQLEQDSDQDGIELDNMIENLESAERLLNRFRGNRRLEQRPLIGCGHVVIMMVDPAHNPKAALSGCHELELNEIVR